MNILVINCGSSSLKFQLIDIEERSEQALAQGVLERIGGEALLTLRSGARRIRKTAPVRKQRDAMALVLEWLVSPEAGGSVIPSLTTIHAVGHRVVHGGEKFRASVRINAKVMTGLEDCIDLAPIHNPANINGIRAVQEILGTVATGGVDAIAFTGGIGQKSCVVREQILRGLQRFGIEIDSGKNTETVGSREGKISKDGLIPEVWVIPTNEELMIARDVLHLVRV
jgi:acetate kinase